MTTINVVPKHVIEFEADDGIVDRDPYSLDLAEINVANAWLFQADAQGPWFKRLRDEEPVHYCADHPLGPYWSVTRYDDIKYVDIHPELFSSEPTITMRLCGHGHFFPLSIVVKPKTVGFGIIDQ